LIFSFLVICTPRQSVHTRRGLYSPASNLWEGSPLGVMLVPLVCAVDLAQEFQAMG